MVVNDSKEYEQLIVQNKLDNPETKTYGRILLPLLILDYRLPQNFNFSRMVPLISNLIKAFISDFYKFGRHLLGVDEYIKKVHRICYNGF